jgi:hypothetical protein
MLPCGTIVATTPLETDETLSISMLHLFTHNLSNQINNLTSFYHLALM